MYYLPSLFLMENDSKKNKSEIITNIYGKLTATGNFRIFFRKLCLSVCAEYHLCEII